MQGNQILKAISGIFDIIIQTNLFRLEIDDTAIKCSIACNRWWKSDLGNILIFFSSDSVTRVNDSTQVTFFGDSYSTQVTLRKMETRLTFFHRMARLESQSMTRDSIQSHFYKVSEFLIDKLTSCALKEMNIFCFSNDQDWRKFSVLLV